jgi:hypothetical protein
MKDRDETPASPDLGVSEIHSTEVSQSTFGSRPTRKAAGKPVFGAHS